MARPGHNLSSCLLKNWWSNVGTDDYRPGVQGCHLLWDDRQAAPSPTPSTRTSIIPARNEGQTGSDMTAYVLLILMVAMAGYFIYRQS